MAKRHWSAFLLPLRWGVAPPEGASASDGALLRRYAAEGDQGAFALLVQRHGPTVFGVCCRILGQGPDAEDAFQATFVILARKAPALADREVVGDWLFGVARRTALKARGNAARRRLKEQQMARAEPRPTSDSPELREAIDAAIARLPFKYRAPLILCELEGRSMREAAVELGWPEGTVAGRLSRGRDMLRSRLVRVGLPAVAVAAVPVPASLALATLRSATVGLSEAGAIPASVAVLAATVQRQMAIGRLTPLATVLGLGVIAVTSVFVASGREPGLDDPVPAVVANVARPAVDAFGEPLPEGAIARFGDRRWRHGGQLLGLVFTPDGKTLIGSGMQWANQSWDAATGHPRVTMATGFIFGSAVAVSRDGGSIVHSKDYETLVVADPATGAARRSLLWPKPGPDARARAVAIAVDGRAAIARRNQIRLYDAAGKSLGDLTTAAEVVLLEFTVDGTRLVAGQADGTLAVFDAARQQAIRQWKLAGSPEAIAYGENGDTVIAATKFTTHLFDAGADAEVWQKPGGATGLAVAPDGLEFAAADPGGRIQICDRATGKTLRSIAVNEWADRLAYSPDGATLAVGGGGQTIRLFDVATGRERFGSSASRRAKFSMGLTADGQRLLLATDGAIEVLSAATGALRGQRPGQAGFTWRTVFSPDGRLVAEKSGFAYRVVDDQGRERFTCGGKNQSDVAAAFSPDGSALVVANVYALNVWDTTTGKLRDTFPQPTGALEAVAFGREGTEFVVGQRNGRVAVWDLAKGKVVRETQSRQSDIPRIAYDARLRTIVTSSGQRVLALDADTLNERWSTARSVPDAGLSVAISPDGRWVAYTQGLTICLADAATGQVVRTYTGHIAAVTGLAFAPDSKRLYSSSQDTTVLVWAVEPTP